MTKYKEIIELLKVKDAFQADLMEERINLIMHKLKFLSGDSIPLVNIQSFTDNFEPTYNSLLAEKVKIAGGKLVEDTNDNPQIIIFHNDCIELYQRLPAYLQELKSNKVRALLENKIFITNNCVLQDNDQTYIQDIELLAEIIQPKYFVFGQEGNNWTKFVAQ